MKSVEMGPALLMLRHPDNLLHVAAGFGYAASKRAGDAATHEKCPREDGLWLMDMATGANNNYCSLYAFRRLSYIACSSNPSQSHTMSW